MNWSYALKSITSRHRHRLPSTLMLFLLGMPFLDEITSKLSVLMLPLMRSDLGFGYVQAGLLFTVGEVASMVLEPLTKTASDLRSKRWPVLGGLIGVIAGFAVLGSAPIYLAALIGFALIITGSGTAVNLAQAVLVDRSPDDASRIMTRWSIIATVGTLIASPIVAAALAAGLGWRSLSLLAAAAWSGVMVMLWTRQFPSAPHQGSNRSGQGLRRMWSNVRQALSAPYLLRWVGIVFIAGMLDDVFIGFTALFLQDVVRADAAAISLAIGGQTVGGMLGLLLIGRLLKRLSAKRIILVGACLALAGAVGLITTTSIWVASIALFCFGVGISTWYPLAKGAAYESLPGRSGTIGAMIDLTAPLQAGVPLVVGVVSQSFGITTGVGVLGLAPVAVLLLIPYKKP